MTQDTHTWRVIYHDDSQLHEYDDASEQGRIGRGWHEVNHSCVKEIDLLPQFPFHTQYSVLIPTGAEPVFVRRGYRGQNITPEGLGPEYDLGKVQCIGYKRGEQGCYLFIFGDGSVLMTENFQAV